MKSIQDCTDRLCTNEQLVEKIGLFRIKNYEMDLPENLHSVIQAAYRDFTGRPFRREQIVELTQNSMQKAGCNIRIELDCPKCGQQECSCDSTEFTVDVDRIWEMTRPEWGYRHMQHYYGVGGLDRMGTACGYHPEFRLMTPATNNFFAAKWHIPGCVNLGRLESSVNYRIDPPKLICTIESGEVLLAYLAKAVDDQGYRLIPDISEVATAINWWVAERHWYSRRIEEPDNRGILMLYQEAAQNKDIYLARAKERLSTPSFQDWWAFVNNHWRKVLPNYDFESTNNRQVPDQFQRDFPRY